MSNPDTPEQQEMEVERFPSDEVLVSQSGQCAAAGPRQPGCVTGSGGAGGGEPAGPSYQHGPAAQPSGGQFTQLLALTLLHSTLSHPDRLFAPSSARLCWVALLHQWMSCGTAAVAAAAVQAQDQRLATCAGLELAGASPATH